LSKGAHLLVVIVLSFNKSAPDIGHVPGWQRRSLASLGMTNYLIGMTNYLIGMTNYLK
jgi:hypothetical protein